MISGMSGSHDVYMQPPTKKKLGGDILESDRDRISNIPDGIIGHILSRLPTKEAVLTCLLSRDWKYKWTSIYDLFIDDHGEYFCRESKKSLRFPRFVDKVLELTHDSRIRSFRLLRFVIHDSHHLTVWISEILRRGIQVIVIDSYYEIGGVIALPRCLASCTSLIELKLSFDRCCCSLEIPVKNCFPNLKRLCLNGKGGAIQILNHQSPDTGQLLLNFPLLEILELKYCKFVNVKSVEIWAPELITFKANCLFKRNDHTIKIFGPKLANFYSCYLDNFVLDAPSLYYVELFHHCARIEASETLAVRAHSLLQGVPGLTCLKLHHTVFQAYVQWRRGLDLPTFDRLKRLEVTAFGGSKPLLELLKAMPNLEYLNIMLGHKYEYEQKETLPLCIVSRLKEVKFIGFHGESGAIDLIKLFLENAKKLERVFVYLHRSPYMRDIKMIGQLSTLASKSAACVTISKKGWGTYSFEQESSLETETHSCNVR